MAARLLTYPKFTVLDNNGDPLAGGKVYTYAAGGTSNKATYTDSTEGTANTNPVILDSNGQADIWLLSDDNYHIVVKDSTDTTTYADVDEVSGIADMNNLTITVSGSLKLGGNLNTNGNAIVSSSNGNIAITPNGNGVTQITNLTAVDDIDMNGNDLIIDDTNSINDDSNNEYLQFSKTSSAVNELTIANAATGNAPTLSATGDNTNIGITFTPKGSGQITFNDYSFPAGDGSSGQILQLNSDGSALEFVTANYFPRGFIWGFEMSNGTDSSHDIDISEGQATDSSGSVDIATTATLTKQIDAAWSAGDDAGGFPSGITLSNNTWYHVFVITNGSTVDAGFDTSTSAANLLSDASGYTAYRRIGSVLTNGSANIVQFIQIQDRFMWANPPLDNAGSFTANTRTNVTLSVPPDYNMFAQLNVYIDGGVAYISFPSVDDESGSTSAAPLNNSFGGSWVMD